MTDVKDKRSFFEAQPNSPADVQKKRKPAPPPKLQKPSPALVNSCVSATPIPVTVSTIEVGEKSSSDRISKLSPALLNNARGLGQTPVMMGGGGGAKTKSASPSPKKKPTSKQLKKATSATSLGAAPSKARQTEMGAQGVGLLASVTRGMSSSAENVLDDASSSSSAPSVKPRLPMQPKSASPQRPRKSTAVSMDMPRTPPATSDKPPRPLSTNIPHRITSTPDFQSHDTNEVSLSSLRRSSPVVSSPTDSPSMRRRRRNISSNSFESSYSPPPSRSPSHVPSTHPKSTHPSSVHHPLPASRSVENILDDSSPTTKPRSTSDATSLPVVPLQPPKQRRPKPPASRSVENILDDSSPTTKPRSTSDATSLPVVPLQPPKQKRPKPPPPPKKPGLMSKPAPPPKPLMKQLKKSPQFSRRVVSPETPASIANGRVPSRSATPEPPPSPTTEKTANVSDTQRGVASPPLVSSPNAAHLRRVDIYGDISGALSPLPSTPSPRTSQLEAVQRNADSGFASETAEDLASPIEVEAASVEQKTEGQKIDRIGEEEGEEEGEGEGEGESSEAPLEIWDEARLEKARNKRFHIAEELLKTEATYVERLHVIAVKFYGAVTEFNAQNKRVIPEGDVNRIFLNITQIHNLNTNIHDELQERMDTWSTQEGLGDVIERLAPFLKLYAHYTAGFEDAMKMLTTWTKREKKFDALVREFERELSTGLGVAHYMLEPVQRIPRYRLLLTDYLKYIPPGSPDRLPTQKALNIISEAADHSNDRIKELENSNTILSIQRSLQDFEGTLLAPGRLFLRRGQLQKFSRKTTTPRMFFLFSDMLLHTEPAGTDVYKFKNEMPIFMMKVGEPVVSLVPHSFNVESTTRSLILVASSEAEKMEWIMELRKAISEERKKRSSLRREMSTMVISGVFGAQAPIMVPDKSVTMCQACSAAFTFTFRRHHCRGCGKVVCGGCSQWKAYLPYLKKFERVCEKCNYVSKSESGEDVDGHPPPSPKMSKKEGGGGILDLKGYEEDTIKGGYVLSLDGRKWSRLWYQLKQDFCLYKFRAHEDIKAMSSLPLPGYIVNADQVTHTITLIHPSEKKELSDTFRLENPEDFDIWVLALEGVVRLEVPSLPAQVKISPPPDERFRSQSMRDLNAVAQPEDSPLENSI